MRKTILRISFLLASFTIAFLSRTNQSGPGATYTGAPSENNCTSCHTGSSVVTSGTKWNSISLTGNYTGNGYIPDSSYTLTLKYVETGKVKWGYQITALDGTNSPAGTFSTPDSRSQAYSATVNSKTRSYLGHTSTGSNQNDSTVWSIKWKAPATNVGVIKFYINLNVTNNNSSDQGDLVYGKTFSVSPSTLLPALKVKIRDSVYCSGASLTFDAQGTNSPTSWDWQFPNFSGANATDKNQNPTRAYATGGPYKAICRIKNAKGFSSYDTFTFSVIQGATLPQTSPTGSANLCKGDSISLRTITPTTGHTYKWSNGATSANILVKDSGTYTVTVRNTNNCYRTSAPIKLTWRDKPSIQLLKSFSGDTICNNVPFSVAQFIVSGPADSFSFVSAKGPFSKKDTIVRTQAAASTTYSGWAKNSFGCVSPKASVTINTKAPASAPAVSVTNISYTGMQFNWTKVTGAYAYRISFDTGKTWLAPTAGDTFRYYDVTGLIGNTTKNAMVVGLTNGQCSKSLAGTASATTLTCAAIPYTAKALQTKVCKGSTAQIVVNGMAGKKFGVAIDGNFRGTDTVQTVTVNGTKTFTVGVIDSFGVICGYTNKTVTIQEDTASAPGLGLASSLSFCSNSPVSLPVTASKPANADSVIFVKNNLVQSVKTCTGFTFTVDDKDSIWARGKNVRGCVSAKGAVTRISVNPIPNAAFTSANVHFLYNFIASQKGGKHDWTVDTMHRTGDTGHFDLTNYATKTVKVKHTITVNGCSSSDSVTFTVPDFAGLHQLPQVKARLYPNPASDILYLQTEQLTGIGTLRLYQASGKLVYSQSVKNGLTPIQITALPEGILQYSLITSSSQTTGSIVIRR